MFDKHGFDGFDFLIPDRIFVYTTFPPRRFFTNNSRPISSLAFFSRQNHNNGLFDVRRENQIDFLGVFFVTDSGAQRRRMKTPVDTISGVCVYIYITFVVYK